MRVVGRVCAAAIGNLLPILLLVMGSCLVPPNAWGSVSYGYDPLGRIVTGLYDNGACLIYTYDAGGNRLSQTVLAPPQNPTAWDTAAWGSFSWSSSAQLPTWGSGSFGCFQWTPQ